MNGDRGVPDMQAAYANVFGQGLWTIGGSITAFFVGQIIDVNIFHRIRKLTGDRWIWLRATGRPRSRSSSTVLSCCISRSCWGRSSGRSGLFLAVGTVNYAYKMTMAVLLSPLIYLSRNQIEKYLGPLEAERLKQAAAA